MTIKAEPGRYALGADLDTIATKPFSIKWATDVWEQDKDSLVLSGLITIESLKPIQVDNIKIKIGNDLFESNWEPNLYWSSSVHTTFRIPFTVKHGKRQATIEYKAEGYIKTTDAFEIDIPKPHYPPSFNLV